MFNCEINPPVYSDLVHFLFLSQSVTARNWYVATNGSDTGSGSEQDPFLSIEKAVSMVQTGENIYVKGGNYYLVATIVVAKSGTSGPSSHCLPIRERGLCLTFQGNRWVAATGELN